MKIKIQSRNVFEIVFTDQYLGFSNELVLERRKKCGCEGGI